MSYLRLGAFISVAVGVLIGIGAFLQLSGARPDTDAGWAMVGQAVGWVVAGAALEGVASIGQQIIDLLAAQEHWLRTIVGRRGDANKPQ